MGAFRTLANGKDSVPAEELEKFLKADDFEYLKNHFEEADGGYNYASFSRGIYGDGEQPVDAS